MKTLVMTGATRGIGRVAAQHLARPHTHLVVLARRAADVPTNARTITVAADLSSSASVRAAAHRISAALDDGSLPPLGGLMLNAGALTRLAMRRVMPALTRTPLASSAHQAGGWLAGVASGEPDAPSGSYVERAQVAPSSAESYDPAREARLWEVLEGLG